MILKKIFKDSSKLSKYIKFYTDGPYWSPLLVGMAKMYAKFQKCSNFFET